MQIDPLILYFVVGALGVLLAGLLMTALRQPLITGYILAGIALGPHGFELFDNVEAVGQLGAVGVVLLLFFIGLDISPRQMLRNWRVAVFGTSLEILATVGLVALLGWLYDWPPERIVLVGFVLSLSCTAIVVDHLVRHGEMDTRVGRDTLMILIAQDIFVIPMLIILGFMAEAGVPTTTVVLQLIGGGLVIAFVIWLLGRDGIRIPGAAHVEAHPELQVFLALLLCFGFALITGIFQLSTALGAFLAGLAVGQARGVSWVREHLDSLRVVFIAIFFASIGMLIDFGFVLERWSQVLALVLLILVINTFVNALIMKGLGESWPEALYAGALLAHVGEFSFVLAAIGYNSGIVGPVSYQFTIAVIAISLALGPAWVSLVRWLLPGLTPAR